MDYSTFEQTMEQITVPEGMEEWSVSCTLEQVTDRRHKRGVRSSVALVLTLILLAKLAGMTTPLAIAEWVRFRADWLRSVQPTRRKTLRGTLGHEQPDQRPLHQLALYETKTGLLLKEQVTGEKHNELSIVSEFLTPLWVSGRIVSADALHTQHAFCTCVRRWNGHYLLIAQDNQACLRQDLELFFSEPPADCRDWRTARKVNKGHGRLEICAIVVSSELNEFLADKWTGVAQVFRLTRTVIEDGQTSIEVVYGITSLSPAQADADRLLADQREHGAIENRLHWRRDVTLREDACQVRKGEAPRVLAVLNSFLLALLDWQGVPNVPHQMRIFDARPALAVQLLFGSLLTFK